MRGAVDLALLAHGAHFGPTLGVLGLVLAVFVLPVLASTVLWYAAASGLHAFSVWVVCAPTVLVCLAALVFCAAVRFDMPLTLRVSTAVVLICLSVFLVVVCIGAEGTHAMRAALGWVSAAAPHWVVAGTVLLCGAVQLAVHGRCSDRCRCSRACYGTLFCCGCCGLCLQPREDDLLDGASSSTSTSAAGPSGEPLLAGRVGRTREQEENRSTTSLLAGLGQVGLGVLWGATAVLAHYAGSSASAPVSWPLVFVPWWACDLLVVLVFFVLLFFSFGAMDSSVLTIDQQCLVLLATVLGAALKALVALALQTDGAGVPLLVLFVAAVLLEAALVALGCSLAFARNSSTIVLGAFLGEDARDVQHQIDRATHYSINSASVPVPVSASARPPSSPADPSRPLRASGGTASASSSSSSMKHLSLSNSTTTTTANKAKRSLRRSQPSRQAFLAAGEDDPASSATSAATTPLSSSLLLGRRQLGTAADPSAAAAASPHRARRLANPASTASSYSDQSASDCDP